MASRMIALAGSSPPGFTTMVDMVSSSTRSTKSMRCSRPSMRRFLDSFRYPTCRHSTTCVPAGTSRIYSPLALEVVPIVVPLRVTEAKGMGLPEMSDTRPCSLAARPVSGRQSHNSSHLGKRADGIGINRAVGPRRLRLLLGYPQPSDPFRISTTCRGCRPGLPVPQRVHRSRRSAAPATVGCPTSG